MTRVLGIDPGLGCTGLAVVASDKTRAQGRIVAAGVVRETKAQAAATFPDRLLRLLAEVEAWVEEQEGIEGIVVEFPAGRGRGPKGQTFGRRSALWLPRYGVVAGALFADMLGVAARLPARIFAPASDEWPGRDVPKTGGDEHKKGRVRYVEAQYGLKPGELGAATVAGNAADAVLLARWGMWRVNAHQGGRS